MGLAVKNLASSASFFIKTLGFNEIVNDPSYPKVFVSDGTTMITLWGVKDPETATSFDRRGNVGLHHLAFAVQSEEKLTALHEVLSKTDGVTIEFAPQYVGNGPSKHMMVYEPSGIRIEFFLPQAN